MQYGAVDVKCPFYKEETRNSVKCEGIISVSSINNFETSIQKQSHMQKYCCADYEACPFCEAVMLNYP